jgi:hypothetical protein
MSATIAARPSVSRPDGPVPDDPIPQDRAARRKLLAALEGLPEIVEATSYGYPAFKVGKKFLCRIKDADTLVVTCPLEEKEMLMAAAPRIYFETDHYRGWPAVLVRIGEIEPDELRHRLRKAWLAQAPKRVARQFLADSGD